MYFFFIAEFSKATLEKEITEEFRSGMESPTTSSDTESTTSSTTSNAGSTSSGESITLSSSESSGTSPNISDFEESNKENMLEYFEEIGEQIPQISSISSRLSDSNMQVEQEGEISDNSKIVPEEDYVSTVFSEMNKNIEFQKVEKRKMGFMAETTKIIGRTADLMFSKSKVEIRRLVKDMNHATRFWLAVKFYRMLKIDFRNIRNAPNMFSKKQMCELLGIGHGVIKVFSNKPNVKNKSVLELMKMNKFLSPVERQPKRHEYYFRTHASNYENLKVGGLFKFRE